MQQPQLAVGVGLDVGKTRAGGANQDSLGTYAEYQSDPELLATKGMLYVIADGMGGVTGGREASQTAIKAVMETYYADPDTDIQRSLDRAIQAATAQVYQRGQTEPGLRGMGTTLVAAVVRGTLLVVANVGDSRAYLLRQGEIRQLSVDHTWVQEQVRYGLITADEAAVHPRRNVLVRNVGHGVKADPDFTTETLEAGDKVVLCSDGLWGSVSDSELRDMLQEQDLQLAAKRLVDLANAHGGPDNISVIAVRFDGISTAKLLPAAPVTVTSRFPSTTDQSTAVQPAAPWRPPGQLIGIGAMLLALVVLAGGGFAFTRMARGGAEVSGPGTEAPNLSGGAGEPSSVAAPASATREILVAVLPTARATTGMSPTVDTAPAAQTGSAVQTVTAPLSTTVLGIASTVGPADATAVVESTVGPAPAAQATLATTTTQPIRIFEGNTSIIHSVAFSPDGQTLASASDNGSIALRQVSDGAVVRTLEGHTAQVNGVAFAPDGQILASASGDNTIKLWQVGEGALIRSLEGHTQRVNGVAFTPDGQVLASASDDRTVELWQVSDGVRLGTLTGHAGNVTSVAFSPDGQLLASASSDATVELWRVSDGSRVRTLTGHAVGVMAVAFAPDGETIASASSDSTIKIWRTSDGALLHTLSGHAVAVTSLAFAPNGNSLASASADATIKVWRSSDGVLLTTMEGNTQRVTSVAFAPDGRTLASAFWDGTVKLWEVQP